MKEIHQQITVNYIKTNSTVQTRSLNIIINHIHAKLMLFSICIYVVHIYIIWRALFLRPLFRGDVVQLVGRSVMNFHVAPPGLVEWDLLSQDTIMTGHVTYWNINKTSHGDHGTKRVYPAILSSYIKKNVWLSFNAWPLESLPHGEITHMYPVFVSEQMTLFVYI